MPVNVIMPHMGESVVEGKILSWLKRPGEAVAEDEPLVEIETDKITVEVPSPAAGVLREALAEEGAVVKVEDTIAIIEEGGEARAAPPPPPPKERSAKAPPPRKKKPAPIPPAERPRQTAVAPPPAPAVPPPSGTGVKAGGGPVSPEGLGVLASPAVRRHARQLGVDLRQVEGTGRMGRITREDVTAFAERAARKPEKTRPAPADRLKAPPKPRERPPDVDEELVPLTPMRRAIAQHMVRSSNEAPHVTTVAEVDMTEVDALRKSLKDAYEEKGARLTYTVFILNAVARGLREFPDLNASWTDKGILVKYRINLGLAVAVEEGLVVPVIRDADRLSVLDLAKAVGAIAEKTRKGKVAASDMAGGTFTITNPGVFGAVISTPIIHQPQAAILATGRIADAPAVVDGRIVVRKRMFLSLSYDHRVVDGATAVKFLQRVREILERADFET